MLGRLPLDAHFGSGFQATRRTLTPLRAQPWMPNVPVLLESVSRQSHEEDKPTLISSKITQPAQGPRGTAAALAGQWPGQPEPFRPRGKALRAEVCSTAGGCPRAKSRLAVARPHQPLSLPGPLVPEEAWAGPPGQW